MREFKLKQWYPDLPLEWKGKDNVIVVKRSQDYFLHPSLKQLGSTNCQIFYKHVENNPEYWEEIHISEFEILDIAFKNGKLVDYNTITSVHQYDLDGNFIKEWESAVLAGKELGISHANITTVCKGKRKKCGNFNWKHIKE